MEKRTSRIKKSDMIASKWIGIIIIIYLPILFVITHLIKLFRVADIYEYYYTCFIVDLLWGPGITLFLIGLIINELIYFLRCKDNKKIITLILSLGCICSITYMWIPNSKIYNDYKDLHYVMENTYCEDIQELKDIYINITTGKLSSKALYIQTSDLTFIVQDNIINENDYASFKSKYSKVKDVKIKYLPNSKILLSIEPIKDES